MDGNESTFTEQVTWLISYVRELEDENYRLKLSIALKNHKRPRGRPKKREVPIDTDLPIKKRGRPRKNRADGESLLAQMEALHKKYDVSKDTEALALLTKDMLKSEGLRESRSLDPKMKSLHKTIRTRVSKARKSQKI